MALSYVKYTANGSTNQFAVTFSYIQQSDVKVYIDGVEDNSRTFVNASLIQTSSTPSNGAIVNVKRETSNTSRIVDFQDGSVLTESDLDTSANQNFFTVQENFDRTQDTIQLTTADVWDAQSKKISNVANPTADQDGVTKHYLENTWLSTSDKANITTVSGISSAVSTLAGISSNITSVDSNASNINTVAGSIANVNTVATNIADITTVANDLNEAVSEIETVASDLQEVQPEIDTVAGSIANVNTVGGAIANVNTVAGISSNVTTVAGISSDVTGVAGISTAVSNVNSNSTNINAVNSNSANINTVAGANSNITTLAGISSDITSVAGISSAVSSVNSNSSNINAVNSNSTNINTVAGISSNITTVAGISSDVTTVAGANSNISTVASNISGVNSFAERYRVASSDPSSSLDEGDLVYNSTSNVLKYYNGSAWVNVEATDTSSLASNGFAIAMAVAL